MPPLPQQEQPNPQAAPPNPQQALPQTGPVPQQSTPAPATPQQQVSQAPSWEAAIPTVAERHNLDPELLRRVLKQEHGWENGKPLTSKKGAVGPMQLMPDTAKRYNVDPMDPYQNLGAGAAELSRLLKKYNGHYARALAAYNAGEGAVDKVPNGIPAYAETQDYVLKILQGYRPPAQSGQIFQKTPQQGSPLTPELGGPPLTHGQWLMEQLGADIPDPVQSAMGWMQRNVNVPLERAGEWTGEKLQAGMGKLAENLPPQYPGVLRTGTFQPPAPSPSATGVYQGAGMAAGQLLGDPRNWPLLASGAARPALQRLMTGGFGVQLSHDSYQVAQDLYENWDKYNEQERAQKLTTLATLVGGALASIFHAARGEAKPTERQVETTPTTPTAQAPTPTPVQIAPRQEPSIAQEGGPRPVTSPGISGGREIGGQHPEAGVSAPIEGAGGTTGTVTPKPTAPVEPHRAPTAEEITRGGVFSPEEERIRREARERIAQSYQTGLFPSRREGEGVPRAEGERRQFLKSPEQVQREVQQRMAEEDAAQEQRRQAWEQSERERQAQLAGQPAAGPRPSVTNIDDAIRNADQLVQRARSTGDPETIRQAEGLAASLKKKKAEVQGAQRPTGLPEAPTTTTPTAPGEPVQRGAAEAPAGTPGQSIRPQQEPVREPVRPAGQVAPPVTSRIVASPEISALKEEIAKLEKMGATPSGGGAIDKELAGLQIRLGYLTKGPLPVPQARSQAVKQPWKPLPPEQRPRVPAGEVGETHPFFQLMRDFEQGKVYHGTTKEAAEGIRKSGIEGMSINKLVKRVADRMGFNLKDLTPEQKEQIGSAARAYNMQSGTASVTPSPNVAKRWSGKGGEFAARVAAILGKSEAMEEYKYTKGEPKVLQGQLTESGKKHPSYLQHLKDLKRLEEDVRKGEITPDAAYQSALEEYRDIRIKPEDVSFAPEQVPARKPVEIPKPTPAPKAASAEQRAAWEQKRRVEGAQRAAAMAANAPPPAPDRAEKAAGLERTFDRKLKQSEADEARVPGGRKRELDAAIQRERAKGPEAAEKAARQMLNRAGRAQSYIESLQRLAKAAEPGAADEEGKPTPSWDETLREALHESSVRTQEDPNTGKQIPIYRWVTEKGVQGGKRGLARSRAIDAVTAEIYNNIRGNKLREVGERVELDEEGQKKLADIQQKYDAVLQEVRKAGGRPTDEQLEDLKKYMNYIHANRGTRMLAEQGPGSEQGAYGERVPLGTGTPKDFLNEVMGWSQKGHLSKPSPEQITARIGQLQQEMAEARDVAQRLRAPGEPGVAAAPRPATTAPSPRAYYEDIGKAAGLEYVGESSPGVHRFNYPTQAGKTLDISEKSIPETGAVKYLREQAAKFTATPGAVAPEGPKGASVKFMITKADEAALRERGYSQQDIDRMRPEEAGRILATPKTTPAEKPGYGEKNTVFTKDRAEAARKLIRDRIRTTEHTGLDPEMVKAVADIMGYHFEAGIREFAELGKRVIQEFGEQMRPYLQSAYDAMLKRGGEYVSKKGEEPAKTPAAEPQKPVEPTKAGAGPEPAKPAAEPAKTAPKAEELVAGLPKPEAAPGGAKKEPLPIRTWDEIRSGLEKQGYKYEGRDAADTHTFTKAGAVPIKFKLSDADIEHLRRTAELERMVGVAPKEGAKPAPAAKAAPSADRQKLLNLKKQVQDYLKSAGPDSPDRAKTEQLLKEIDKKLSGTAAKPPDTLKRAGGVGVSPEAKRAAEISGIPLVKGGKVIVPGRPEAPPKKGYVTGQRPEPAAEAPEVPKGPSVQQRIVEALRDNRGLEEFTSAELRRAGEPMRLGKGAEEFKIGAETQKAIAAELSKRAGQRGEIEKTAPKLEPAKQAERKQEHVRVDVVHPDDPEAAPVWGKQAIDREDIHKLGQRVDKLPAGEDRNDLANSLNSTSKAFENLNKRISYLSKAINKMREDGVTTRTRVDKNPNSPTYGQKITEHLETLEHRRMLLGRDRALVIADNVPRLKDTLSALEAKPVAPAPERVPTKTGEVVAKTYGSEEVLDEQGRYVGRVAPQTGEKIITPSPAPTEEGEQQRIQSLHQHEADLAKLVRKYGGTPPRKAAIVMAQLRKGIKAIRATLPGGGPASKPYVAPILEGGKLLEKAARAEGKPVPESEIVEARAKGYVTGAPVIGGVDEAADNLHSWLQGKKEAIPNKVMDFIDHQLFRAGPAGQHIAHQILGDLAKGAFGDLKSDEAPMHAALRLQKALDVLSEGRVRSLSAPKELAEGLRPQDLQSSIRAKAFSDAMHVAKTGVVPAPKPPKSEQAGFLSFGRRGRAAVPPARAAQVSRNAIGQLAKTVEALPASRGMDRRIEQAMRAGQQAVPTTPGSFANAYQRTVTLGKAIGQAFTKLPRWQDFEKALGDFRVIRTRQAYESRNFVKTLQDKLGVPSLLRQTIHPKLASKEMKGAIMRLEAITNYLEAGGNEQELTRRASLSGPKVRGAYELAAQLNPEEKAIAQAIKEHFEQRARDGLALGILHGYVENYAPHIWKDKGHLASISAELNAGLLDKNFRFAMQRIYGSYFEGEQKGLSPKLKRIDALVAVHDNAFNTAMNTRLLARQLIDGVAADGKPILAFNQSGAIQLTGGQRLDPVKLRMIKRNPALLLKPNSRPFDPNLDMSGYKKIDSPAFQKWIWKGQSGGKNILMQGDAWVHPDYINQLKNLTGQSALRKSLGTIGGVDIRPGDWALKGVAALKQIQLGAIGSFHYIQEGLHDVWHFRNPLHPDNWTGKRLNDAMTDPVVLDGIRHSLNLYEGGADFGDGGAILDRIPGMGKYIRASTDHLFKTFIPSLKADLYKHVLEKNLKYYADAVRQGKIDTDQLKTISARTVNNAFGELDTLTRNKTFQDVLRLTLLAPDFLEARARFVGQSLRPYGHVPFMAMMRNIGLLYAGARVMNQVINGDPLWDAKYWDGVRIGKKVYRVRSIVGDLFHAASNSPSFAYWRLSPLVRPIVAAMAQVRKGVPYRLKDAIADTVPIGLQGEAKKVIFDNIKDPDVSRSIWETIGVREEKYYSPEQRRALEQRSEQRERALRGERSHGLGPLLPALPRTR